VAEFFIIGARFVGITRQPQAAEVRCKLSTMNCESSLVKVPLVITKQLKLYFNNSSRIPTQDTCWIWPNFCVICTMLPKMANKEGVFF
jgi:hypothetical protein